ncbi:succinate dehydrogenase/fumarate reductase iron-sulfur subunit [Pseudoscardovia suis]
MHRTMRPTRRAASTLGGAPVAGGFGASDAGRSWTQDYTLTVDPRTTVLDCLLLIKRTQDPTLAFRYSCGHGMCGSDAVAINGTPSLLCKTTVQQAAQTAKPATPSFRRTAGAQTAAAAVPTATSVGTSTTATTPASSADTPVIDLAPIAAFSVQRDLIADIDPMLDQIRALQPYLQARGDLAMTADGKVNVFEYLQSPEQLAKFEQLTTCIACGVCEASCPVFVGGDAFVGPAALVNQIRFIDDSRDGAASERLAAISESDGLPACQSVRACGLNCPQGIDVGEVIWQFIQGVQTRKQEG